MTRILHQIPVNDRERSPDGLNDKIWCHWADCDNPSNARLYMIECHASAGVRAGNMRPAGWWNGPHGELPDRQMCSECRIITFCSEQCRGYYMRSHRPGLYGKLPPGVSPRVFLT